MKPRTLILGISGPIASGKDAMCTFLRRMTPQCRVLSADRIGHKIYSKGTPAWKKLVHHFGKQILSPNGTVNRKKLSQIVFRNTRKLQYLNRVTHSLIRHALLQEIRQAKKRRRALVIVNAALLHTIPLHDLVDFSWVVWASEKARLSRLVRAKGLSLAEARRRIRAQRSIRFVCPKDTILRNTGTLPQFAKQVRRAYNSMMARWKNSA